MRLERQDIEAAAKAGLISPEQAKNLWLFWQKEHENIPQFRFAHVLYYFGGLLAIAAITLFVTKAWDNLHGLPLFFITVLLFLLGLLLTHYFLKKQLRIPAGIMATFSLAVIPLAVYNLQVWLGFPPPFFEDYHYADFHSWVNWYWVPMELATLLVGVIMFYFYRFPFLLFPISIVLWYMSMDLWPLLFQPAHYSWNDKALFSMFFGLFVIILAIYLDFKNTDDKQDYAYWLYIIGVIIFWGGLSCQESKSEIGKLFYCMINVFMIIVSVFLDRRVFAVFGALGVLGYLGHLSFTIFANSLGFPVALIILGLVIIFMATKWPSIEHKLMELFRPYIPKKILKRIDDRTFIQ